MRLAERRTSSPGRVRDANGLFPWRQASGHVGPGDDLHLLGSDVVVEDGLPCVLHGVQLVGVVITSWGRLPGKHKCCSRTQGRGKTEGERHMSRRFSDSHRVH